MLLNHTLSREQFQKLKQDLKDWALQIQALKSILRNPHDVNSPRLQYKLWLRRRSFRYGHVLACLTRGTPYDRIENPADPADQRELDAMGARYVEAVHSAA